MGRIFWVDIIPAHEHLFVCVETLRGVGKLLCVWKPLFVLIHYFVWKAHDGWNVLFWLTAFLVVEIMFGVESTFGVESIYADGHRFVCEHVWVECVFVVWRPLLCDPIPHLVWKLYFGLHELFGSNGFCGWTHISVWEACLCGGRTCW